jgi:hypothetical protein
MVLWTMVSVFCSTKQFSFFRWLWLCEGEVFFGIPDFTSVVDKLQALITMELQNWKMGGGPGIREGLKVQAWALLKGGTKLYSSRNDTGGGQGMAYWPMADCL